MDRDVLVELPPGRGSVTGAELGVDDERGVLLAPVLGADVVGCGDALDDDRSLDDDGAPLENGARDRGDVEVCVGVGVECAACVASRFAEIGRMRK